ncbi:hypothetical protein AAIB41_10560 [Brucella sp. BE17]|uniref:hypothetical protein n=1 Tax=Brucella sp. BE17 TaxID=3142977 RepID=UPI0031BA1E0F
MKADWNLIREMMGAAIDACEWIEAAGAYIENDRDATIAGVGYPSRLPGPHAASANQRFAGDRFPRISNLIKKLQLQQAA